MSTSGVPISKVRYTPSSLYRAQVSNLVALRLMVRNAGWVLHKFVRFGQWIFGHFLASGDHSIGFYVINPVSNY